VGRHCFVMRLVLGFLAFAILILAIWGIWGGAWEDSFTFDASVKWLQGAGPWAWLAGLLLLVGDLVLPVPGTIVISALGYLYGVFIGGLISSLGLVLAGLSGYGIGRLCGEKFARRWLGDRDFEMGRRLFTKGGGWVVAMSRALPILPEVISCTAGLVRMPFRQFLLALICGSVPMGFLFAAIGGMGREAPGWTIGLSLLVPVMLWWLASRIQRSNIRP
jgi:uncharacterized membrane protein YdjX (TVP38/TMEM64 family)